MTSVDSPTAKTAKRRPAPQGPPSDNAAEKPASRDLFALFGQLAKKIVDKQTYFKLALDIVGSHFNAIYGQIDARVQATNVTEEFNGENKVALVASLVEAMLLEAESDGLANSRVYEGTRVGQPFVVVATPLHGIENGDVIGAISLAVMIANDSQADQVLSELRGISSMIVAYQPRNQVNETNAVNNNASGVQRALERASRYKSLDEFAFALVNSLHSRFDCTQVYMGAVDNRKVRLLAISGMDRFAKNSPGVKVATQSMEECIDAGDKVLYQLSGAYDDDRGTTGYLIHRDWHTANDQAAILSIPIQIEGQAIAVVCLLRESSKSYSPAEEGQVIALLSALGPAIGLLKTATRSVWKHAKESIHSRFTFLWAAKAWVRTMVLGGVAAAVAWFMIGQMPYRIVVPCVVAPSEVRHVVAPFESRIAEAFVSAGDEVEKGQLLLRLDIHDWDLELARVRAEQKSLRLEVDQAIARGDRPAATFANASLKTMAVREELIGWKIKQAEIRAQADGLIVKGDLEERIGQVVSMGEPLLQIATGESYVELRIPERAAAMVHNGASGHFACAAKPNVRVNCRIERVLPASEIIDQKNVFVAETEVDEPPKWLRIGMEGVAKIDAGWQPVWWIAFHPIIDKIQLWIG